MSRKHNKEDIYKRAEKAKEWASSAEASDVVENAKRHASTVLKNLTIAGKINPERYKEPITL